LNGTTINSTGVALGGTQTLSINGGTANGVAYLNGSKVLTTGSALTFDGTNLSLLPSGYSVFGASSAEQMRLTSTGLGIGTSSPAVKLDVRANIAGGSDNTVAILHNYSDTGGDTRYSGLTFRIGSDNGTSAIRAYRTNSSNNYETNLTFWTNPSGATQTPTERMRLDSSGNLGLGVTPSAWSGFKVFEVASAGSALWSSGVTDIRMSANMYYNGNYRYAGTGAASRYEQSSGIHAWYTAPSGTAGNAISFTQAMTLDASGNLLVGTTSNSINGSVGSGFSSSNTTGGSGVAFVYNSASSSSDNAPCLSLLKASTTTSSSARFVQFYANGSGTPMGGIVGNGASNVQFATLSDVREKQNIQDITGSLAKINALRPVEFDWIADGSHVSAGFVAQEVEPIFPEFIIENIANDGQEERKGLTGGMTGGIVAHLVKAIQELNAKFEEYKATHP
jgi:hypothetical protein